jgi:ArsR family transcriptional regulator, arsenate/arsenite/antimonite-responsive transcriptional repressor
MLSKAQAKELRSDAGTGGQRLALMFAALSDTGRFGIFRLFMQHRDFCVTEVANIFSISVPAASQQLKVMELSGLVERERKGQKICYSVKRSDPIVRSLMRLMLGGRGT